MKTTIKLIRNILEKFNLIANLTAKNLALHQQLIVLNRSIKRPQIKTKDRLFWIILYLFWNKLVGLPHGCGMVSKWCLRGMIAG
jgi:hypothetical protein